MSEARTFTVRDLEQRLGVREHTILGWIHSHQLKAINVGTAPGKKKPRWRVTEEDLMAFLAQRASNPPVVVLRRRKQRQSEVIEFIK